MDILESPPGPTNPARQNTPRDSHDRRAVRWFAAVVVLCLALRTTIAMQRDVICPDGAFFLRAAKMLAAGDPSLAFHRGFNVYPVILAELHELGLDYEAAAKLWGLATSTLTLLPLWLLFRRQFGEPTAIVACFLYAVHPGLAEWSVEPIRDSTFWLSFATTLYFANRAAASRGGIWILPTLTAFIVAVNLRTEGWFLAVPIAASFVAAVKGTTTFFSDLGILWWTVGASLSVALYLGAAAVSQESKTTEAAHLQVESPRPPTLPAAKRASNYFKRLINGFHPLLGAFVLAGVYSQRRRLSTLEHGSLAMMNLLLLGSIWYYLRRYGDMNTRYFYPMVMTALPYAAATLIRLIYRCRERLSGFALEPFVRPAAFCFLAIAGLTTAIFGGGDGRRREAELGRQIQSRFGAHLVVAEFGGHYLPAHYADAQRLVTLSAPVGPLTYRQLKVERPALIVLRGQAPERACYREFLALHSELGYEPVPTPDAELADAFDLYRLRTTVGGLNAALRR